MPSFFTTYNNAEIHYLVFGRGEKLLLCLHGFGETADSFEAVANLLSVKYTVIAIDLPLHGQTRWVKNQPFIIEDLKAIVDSIPLLKDRRFSVMGFSMGGRVALQLYQFAPDRIDQLILIAPDGLRINIWYRIATQTGWGNKLFLRVMKKPARFFLFTRILKKCVLINLGVFNYIHRFLTNDIMRMRLYHIWTTMRKIKPDVPFIQSLIQKHTTPVILIYGQYDRVIPFTTGEKFKAKLGDYCTLYVLPTGHRLLHEKNSSAIAALL
ncbi:MAG: alpha/beta hydrolase [Agriterribacter sp.]